MKSTATGLSTIRIAARASAIAGACLLIASFTASAEDAISGRLPLQGYTIDQRQPPLFLAGSRQYSLRPSWQVTWQTMPRYVLVKHDATSTQAGYFSLVIGAEFGNDWNQNFAIDPWSSKALADAFGARRRIFRASIAFDEGQQIRMTSPSEPYDRKPQPALGGSQGVEIRLPPKAKRIVRVEIAANWPAGLHEHTYNQIGGATPYPAPGAVWRAGEHPWIWPLNLAVADGIVLPEISAASANPRTPKAKKAAAQDTGPGSPAYEAALAAIAAMLAALAVVLGITISPADPDQDLIDDKDLIIPTRKKKDAAPPPPEEHWTSPLPPTDGGPTPPEEHWTSPLPPGTPTGANTPPPLPAPLGEDGLPLPDPPKVKIAPREEHWTSPLPPPPPPEEHWAQPQPAPTAVGGRDTANAPPAPTAPTKTAAQLADDAYIQAEADAAAKRGPADPNSPAEILKRAKAGDLDAQKQWDAMKAEGKPTVADSIIQKSLDAVVPFVAADIYREIGGAETIKELAKTDWTTEVEKSAGALKDAAAKAVNESVDFVTKTAKDGVSLLQMDNEELASTWNQATKEANDSAIGKLVKQGASLTDMSLDEALGTAKETVSDAAGAIHQLYAGMTADEFQAHLGDAERAIFVEKQKLWQTDPEAARKFFAAASVEALKQALIAATGETAVSVVGKVGETLGVGVKVADTLAEGSAASTVTSELSTAQQISSEASTAQKLAADANAARQASLVSSGTEAKTAVSAGSESLESTALKSAAGETEPGMLRRPEATIDAGALKKTEIGAGGTTVSEPIPGSASKSGAAESLTGDGKPLSQLTQEEKSIAAAETGQHPTVNEAKPEKVGRSDGTTEPGTSKPDALPAADKRIIIHTEDGKAYEIGVGEVKPDGSPLTPHPEAPKVDPKAVTGDVPMDPPSDPVQAPKADSIGRAERAGADTSIDPPKEPAAPAADKRIIIHTEDGKAYELGVGEVKPDGSPLSQEPKVDPKAVTDDIPKSAPAESLTGDGKPVSSLTQEEMNVAKADTQVNPALRNTEIGAGGTTVSEPIPGGVSKSGPTESLTGDSKLPSQLTQEEKDIAAAETQRMQPVRDAQGAAQASGSETAPALPEPAAQPKTAQFEKLDLPGDKPTGPRGTERLEPKELPDGGKDSGPGVERGPDGRHPIRMTREEARLRLGEDIEAATPRPSGADAPAPESARDLPRTKLPETAARPAAELPETALQTRPELPNTVARPLIETPDGPTTGKLPDPEMPAPAQPETVKRPVVPESSPASKSGGQTAADPKEPLATASNNPSPHLEDKPPIHPDNGPPITGDERQDLLVRARDPTHVPEVSVSDMDRYKEAVLKARAAAGPGLSCEKAQQSLVDQLGSRVAMNDGKLVGVIDHSVVITKEGLILDPVARQAIEQRYVTAAQVKAAGLTKAMEEGVFTPKQWTKFNSLGRHGKRF